jgi:HlyD family secretion protein
MKKVIIIAIIAVLSGSVFFFAKKKPAQIRYETESAHIGDVRNTITATGKVQPLEQVEVSTQVSGIIDKITVDFNDKVKANQIIAVLDQSVLGLQVSQSNAALSSAQSEFSYRKSLFERANALKEKNMISADDYDLVKYNYERSKNSLETARIDNSRAKTNLGYAIIRSPIDGVVLSRDVEQGQTVAASLNAPKLFTIARDLTKMQVLADIDEADIGQVKVGMSVKFTVDAWADSIFSGAVESIRFQPNTASTATTYTVVISADNSKMLLLPGMTATAEIITSGAENVLVIPSRALRFRPQISQNRQRNPQENSGQRQNPPSGGTRNRGGQTAIWLLEDGVPVQREIQTGERSSLLIEVKSGLSEGDKVIISQSSSANKNPPQQNASPLSGNSNPPRVRGMR